MSLLNVLSISSICGVIILNSVKKNKLMLYPLIGVLIGFSLFLL